MRILTVGHGTLSAEAFTALVVGAEVEVVVDVRRYPGSRRHPHFGASAMGSWLGDAGVEHLPMADLGGRRRPTDDLTNAGWRNPQFRAYADHMATSEFRAATAALIEVGRARQAAVLCSESVWWRCHRRLLADHLELIEDVRVAHLFHDGRQTPHPPTPNARVSADGTLVYPADADADDAESGA